MAMNRARIGIGALALTGIAMAGFGTPAHAQSQEKMINYWNNAQHTIQVGQRVSGPCDGYANWGTTSSFFDVSYEGCVVGPP